MFAPVGNVTVLPAAAWHPEPTFRGTFSILSSCLVTMLLCVWTSLHINLPEHRKEDRLVYRKVKWLFIGLLAPEIFVWTAWKQKRAVKELSRHMIDHGLMEEELPIIKSVSNWFQGVWNKLLAVLGNGQSSKKGFVPPGREHAWTDVHSWYVMMGGLAFEDSAAEESRFMPGHRQRMTLTKSGVERLVQTRLALLPDVSREYIEDKSKSDGLAKLLTCWQAIFFCVNCVFRVWDQLSVSLLELNVFAHAVCALLLIYLWWNKPRDVQEPTLITSKDGLDFCAWMCLNSEQYMANNPFGRGSSWQMNRSCTGADCWEIDPERPLQRISFDLNDRMLLFGPSPVHQKPCLAVSNTHWKLQASKKFCDDHAQGGRDELFPRSSGWTKYYKSNLTAKLFRHCGLGHGVQGLRSVFDGVNGIFHFLLTIFEIGPDFRGNEGYDDNLQRTRPGETFISVDRRALRRLERAYNLIEEDETPAFSEYLIVDRSANVMVNLRDVRDFTGIREYWSKYSSDTIWTYVGFTLLPLVYGGLHLTAWAGQFQSDIETFLWRFASITIMATGPACIGLSLLLVLAIKTLRFIRKKVDPSVFTTLLAVGYGMLASYAVIFLAIWYAMCRSFIVAESFIMLAHLPETAIRKPTWANYLPSFS